MRRFWVSPEQIVGDRTFITGADAYHLRRVLRLKEGSQVLVFDGTGQEYKVLLETVNEKAIQGRIIETSYSTQIPSLGITLVQAIPKGSRMELIIQKATELGIFEIRPVLTSRTVVKLEGEKKAKRHQRWQSIVKEACKQSGCGYMPVIQPIQSLDEYLQTLDQNTQGFVLWEEEKSQGIKTLLRNFQGDKLVMFVGPEGGFSSKEIQKIRAKNISSVTLGSRILRTETAAITAMALVQYELGDLG